MISLRAIAASPGIAIGEVYLLESMGPSDSKRKTKDPDKEFERLKKALDVTKNQLEIIRTKTEKELGHYEAMIFDTHLLILEDPTFLREVETNILKRGLNAEKAIQEAVMKFSSTLEAISDPYFKARSVDIEDVGRRIINNILRRETDPLAMLESPVIVIAKDLTPSDTVGMNKKMVLGFATDLGSLTSHTAILARSLGIPAVVGLDKVTENVHLGDKIIVDGIRGIVVINPSPAILAQYRKEKEDYDFFLNSLNEVKFLEAKTIDGHQVEVAANIGSMEEVDTALSNGAEGIGLLRSEFFYLDRDTPPSEEELFHAYKVIAEKMLPRSVIVRTLDVGGDKYPRYLKISPEANPFLGLRGIRLSLSNKVGRELMETQLKAIVRAGKYGNLKVMFPMISDIREVRETHKIFDEVASELSDSNQLNDRIEIGIMIETPSAALTADILAKEVDFFSIGTNDLIQYTMAADRTNAHVSNIYDSMHPSILRLVKRIIDCGHQNRIWVGMCGEMASDPLCIRILLGMGLDEFSVTPFAVPRVKQIVRSTSYEEAISVAEEALRLETASEIRLLMEHNLRKHESGK
ncbi:MAG: phosphoenolpyruvate--protein phosphotransferase [Candidatus Bathyarchaeia archaeon]